MSRVRPLRTHAVPPHIAGPSDTLFVLLPGAYGQPEDFLEHGFDATLRALCPNSSLLLVECDLTAFADGSLAGRLHDSVIRPARASGHRRIVLGGISAGALTALIHADEYPDTVDALMLIAPYPGNRMVTRQIADAGTLTAWAPGPLGAEDGEQRGWRALQGLAAQADSPVWLGFGESDRFAPGQHMMAAALPPAHCVRLPGTHDWPTWAALWRCLLETGPWT